MPFRKLILVGLVLALPACTWLPWHQRPPRKADAPAVPAVTRAPVPPPLAVPVVRAVPVSPAPLAVPTSPASPIAASAPDTPPERARAAAGEQTPRRQTATFDLRGSVRLTAGAGQQLHPGERVDTVVYFVPAHGTPTPRPRQVDVITHHRDFRPTALVVPQGSTVTYVNRDKVRHNVFSVTPGAGFNLGYQPGGTRDRHVFDEPGLVLVNCNVHHSMEMDVLVVPTPYAGRVAADGSFVLRDLPAGSGTLVAWNPRARMVRQPLSLPLEAPVALNLLAERPRVVTRVEVGR